MKLLYCLWALLLGAGGSARAQQLLCERDLVDVIPSRPSALLRLQPDTLRLLTDYNPAGPDHLQVRLRRVNTAQCDTLPTQTATLVVNGGGNPVSCAASNRRGQVLIAQAQRVGPVSFDSSRILLQLLARDGSRRWQRMLRSYGLSEGVSGILEAPDNGFFLVGGDYNRVPSGPPVIHDCIIRLDSTGRELWRRRYRQFSNRELTNPVYTRSGTLLCTSVRTSLTEIGITLREFNQRGDSLRTQPLIVESQQYTSLLLYSTNAFIPLRNGGFALAGQVDSAGTGYYRPFLVRLDPQGNVVWRYIFRRQPLTHYRFDQPRELADGSLLVVVSNGQTARNQPFWLFRFSAAGQLTATYPFLSQVLPPYSVPNRQGYFSRAMGLESLSDSTLMLVAAANGQTTYHTYLAHLRVPGLPRVLDNHLVPAADPLAPRAPTVAWPGPAAYPNPATTTLTLPYRLPPATRAARLTCTDALGRQVYQQALDPHQPQATLPVAAWPPGLYLFTLLADGQVLGRQRVAITP